MNIFASLVEEFNQREKQDGWFPPNWNFNGYTIEMNLTMARTIRDKKKSLHNAEEKRILENEKIIRSCYCTPEVILYLARFFIGPFELDPFYNPHAKTASYGSKNFTYFDGVNGDGFDISKWEEFESIWENPPFNRLGEAANRTIEFLKTSDAAVAFICSLDMTSYFKEFLKIADYLIILDRVKFVPIPGLKVSQPANSNALFIFNSKKEVPTGLIKVQGSEYYCVNLKNREVFEID